MIENLKSQNYRTSKNLGVSVTADLVTPASAIAPKFLEGATNYTVVGFSSSQNLIRGLIDLKSGYNSIELQADYLKKTVYPTLSSATRPFFNYWYDVVNVYSLSAVKVEIGTKDLYRDFNETVGYLMLYSVTPETTNPGELDTASTKSINGSIRDLIPTDIMTEIELAYKHVNSPYADNVANIVGAGESTTAHGSRLIADTSNNTRYTGASTTYVENLSTEYGLLLYLSPIGGSTTLTGTFSAAPYFTTEIEGTSVIVDKQGNKVSTDQSWMEQPLLSAYSEE